MADATTMNYVYTIGGYAALAAVGYVFYHVKTTDNKKRTTAVESKATRTTQPEPRKEDRKKKQRLQSFTSETAKAQKAPTPAPAPAEPASYASKAKKPEKDEADSNREFALQLAKAQEGTKFATKTESGKQREKTVKQSRVGKVNEPVNAEVQSPPSSTAGADADEESSPVQKPVQPVEAAPAEAAPADPSGVADMLEPAAKGPSVLRLTESTEKPKAKPKAAKAPEVVETKKQRQNRKKAEAAKEAREQAEKERKVLEERQRRAARIAEGRAAKDGSQFMAVNGNKSAWSEGAPASEGSKAADTNGLHQPLDTFEKPAGAKPAEKTKSDASWIAALPSEEEQIEKLKDNDDEWSTVQSKSVKAKKNKQVSSASSGDEQTPAPVQKENQKPTAQPARPAPAPKTVSGTSKNFGSFSALSNDDPAEEAEEEWDV